MKISKFVSLILEAISEDNKIFLEMKRETEKWREDIKAKDIAVKKTISDLGANDAKKMVALIQRNIKNTKDLMEFDAVKKYVHSLDPSQPKDEDGFSTIIEDQILTGTAIDTPSNSLVIISKKILAAYRIIKSGEMGREHETNIKSYFTNLLSGIANVTKPTKPPYPDLIIKSKGGKNISEKLPKINDNNMWIEVKSGVLTSRQLADSTITGYGLNSFSKGMGDKKAFTTYLNRNKNKVLETFGLKAPGGIDNIYFNEKKGIVNTLRRVKTAFTGASNKFYYLKKGDQIVYAILSKEKGITKIGTILLELIPGTKFSFKKYGDSFEKLYLSPILHAYNLRI